MRGLGRVSLALILVSIPVSALALQRTALVIGNSAYRDAPLHNPVNDATDLARLLERELGFDVILRTDVDRRRFEDAVREFRRRLQRRGGVGLFYYAGHGIQVAGRNYLIPVGADIRSETDVRYKAVDAGFVLGHMDEAHASLNIVILDACRDNPYERSFRSSSRGLARLEMPSGELGSLLAYSTAPGTVAADGRGRNSPYTGHLLQALKIPGLTLEQVFKRVTIGVYRDTDHRQRPWIAQFLLGDFYFLRSRDEALPKTYPPPRPAEGRSRYALTVNPEPADARVRILNIGPRYHPGIRLEPGRYHIEVAKPGYEKETRWITLAEADQAIVVALKPKERPPERRGQGREKTWTDPVTGMEFVWVPKGCFEMGTREVGEEDERPVHRVCVAGFWLARHEVTQAQWRRVMGDNPAHFKKGDDYPVELVSWWDVQAFIDRLNARAQGGFRLPSEAQWEYACRSGGRDETYCGGEDLGDLAWYGDNSGGATHPIAGKRANGLGLYDMSGNVWEWAQDCYHDSYEGAPEDGSAREEENCARRVIRGGSWGDEPDDVRSGFRSRDAPDNRFNNVGFRLARTP